MAIEETLFSDFYKFDKLQVGELKSDIQKNLWKLVIIFDSYDELKGEFI